MIQIIHGQNTVASREYLMSVVNFFKTKGKGIIYLEKDTVKSEKSPILFPDQNLFGVSNVYVIENFLKGKQSPGDKIIQKIQKSVTDIVFWEDDKRTPGILSTFPGAKITEFKIAGSLFTFLDGISSGKPKNNLFLLHQALISNNPEIIFTLLGRRLVDLIISPSTIAPWQQNKLKIQSRNFSETQLKTAVTDLLKIDLAQKTSSSPLDLTGQLEIFMISL